MKFAIYITTYFFLGKHCLNSVFANENFPNQTEITHHQNYASNISVEGLKVYLDLHKTPGPKEYDAIRPLYYPKTVRLSKDIVATTRRF